MKPLARVNRDDLTALDALRKAEDDLPNRPEMVRRLIARAGKPPKQSARRSAQ